MDGYQRTREGLVRTVLELLGELEGERRARITRLAAVADRAQLEALLQHQVSLGGLRHLRHRAVAELRAQRGLDPRL